MNVFRVKHDNVPESPVRTLYGFKGNFLLLPLDVCILQLVNEREDFRPSTEDCQLIAAPIQDELTGRIGMIANYEWPPLNGAAANPVVTVQLAPSANLKGIEDLRVIACQVEVGDAIVCLEGGIAGSVVEPLGNCTYPDLVHHVAAFRVSFLAHIPRRSHGSAVHLNTGELIGMLIATQNQADGTCRGLVYPA